MEKSLVAKLKEKWTYPTYIGNDNWVVDIGEREEAGPLEYILGEICLDGLIYRHGVTEHSHTFRDVLIYLVNNPESFSIAGFENDYSEQEQRFLEKAQVALLERRD